MTFEHDAVIATLAARASDQVKAGVIAIHAGELLEAELHFSLAQQALLSLAALLDSPKPPLRKLAICGPARDGDAELPEWAMKRHGDPDDAA